MPKHVTAILLNGPTILNEVMAGARLRLASSLEIPAGWVKLELKRGEDPDDPKLYPSVNFDVPEDVQKSPPKAKFFTQKESWVKEVIGQHVHNAIREYRKRCEGAGIS